MPPKVPCKVYFSRKNGPAKVLTATTEDELSRLLAIGWKLEETNAGS